MFQGNQQPGYARGHAVILNSNYQIVKTVESGGSHAAADQHEFNLLDGGKTALLTIYQQIPYDLSRLDITTTHGWISDSRFQEINVTDNSVIFEWSALDHVDPFTGYVGLDSSDISGNGRTPQTAWDSL